MVHSEVYLNNCVVSIAPFSTSACHDAPNSISAGVPPLGELTALARTPKLDLMGFTSKKGTRRTGGNGKGGGEVGGNLLLRRGGGETGKGREG